MSLFKKNLKLLGCSEEFLENLNRIYYHNYDLNLLLNLLANGSGVAPALAAIAQFDQVPYQLKFYNSQVEIDLFI